MKNKFAVEVKVSGNVVDTFKTRQEAERAIIQYENEDKRNNSYTLDFYIITNMEPK